MDLCFGQDLNSDPEIMSLLNYGPVFSSKGRKASPVAWLLTVAGSILSVTLFALSIAVPGKMPGSWAWLACIVLFAGLIVYLIGKDRVIVEIFKKSGDLLLLRTTGISLSLEF